MKSSRFLFYLCGDRNKASSRVRGYWIAESLEKQGIQFSIEHRHTKLALFLFFIRIVFCDVVVFQKTYSRWHRWLLNWANVLGKRTVVDLDDSPSRSNNLKTLNNVEAMMRQASLVIVGSQVLLDYAQEFSTHTQLIPSTVKLSHYHPRKQHRNSLAPICLGWIGNGKHYKEDLIKILKAPLTKLAQAHSIKFKLIGACSQQELYDAFGEISGLEIDFVDQIEWSNPSATASSLRDIDIGLYPLLPKDFNSYKCGYKALEYMAMKIPVISSDIAENCHIIIDGESGLLAQSEIEWINHIEKLIKDSHLRMMMGEKGREIVESSYNTSFSANKILTELKKLPT